VIVAEAKPLEELLACLEESRRALIVSCSGCTAVCLTGGAAQATSLASRLKIAKRINGSDLDVETAFLLRQCEPELLPAIADRCARADVLISLACGVGVQQLAEAYPDKWVIPALNTTFAGSYAGEGVWEERCGLCGNCVLHLTGGVCPVTRCAKGLLNGPCGGPADGRCEVDPEVPCAWILIYERLQAQGRLELFTQVRPAKDWRSARDGGLRRFSREGMSRE
jgi:hypothetical protein